MPLSRNLRTGSLKPPPTVRKPTLCFFEKLFWLTFTFLLPILPPSSAANPLTRQTNSSSYIVESIEIPELPLDQALEILKSTAAKSSGGLIQFNFVFLNGKPERTVSLNLQNVPLEQVVDYFAEVAGLAARINGSIVEFRLIPPARPPTQASTASASPSPSGSAPKADAPPGQPKFSGASFDFVYSYIKDISLGWSSESRSKKSESQKQVLFRDTTGRATDAFMQAVEDINQAFGYQKLVPQLSTKEASKDQAIVVMLGPEREAKRFLREAGSRTSPTREAWSGWFWWDDSNEMSKAVIAIFQEQVSDHSLKFYLRRSLLTALGYPGYTSGKDSIFDDYGRRFPRFKNKPSEQQPVNFMTEWDVAILRFCDRFLATDASRPNIKKVITKEWPEFAADLDKAGSESPPQS